MKNSTYIALVLDRSGSISSCLPQMQSALDEFVKFQKEQPTASDNEFLLAQFDTEYSEVYRGKMVDAPKHHILPRGSTALYDAMGKTIATLGEELSRRTEADRPKKVMVCIITDGYENASQEYNSTRISDMIKHQKEKYLWDFVFLGANQDAVLTAQTFGIGAGKALSFVTGQTGMRNAVGALNAYTACYSSSCFDPTDVVEFTETNKAQALEED